MRCSILLIIVQSLLLLLPPLVRGAVVEGVVVASDGILAESTVEAYQDIRHIGSTEPVARSRHGERKGFYRLELPPGTYWLTARGKRGEQEFFSFHGSNPVTVGETPLWIPFAALPSSPPLPAPSHTLTAVVTYHDRPVEGATVSVHPAESDQFRGLGSAGRTTDERGTVSFDLPEGRWRVVARKRLKGKGVGVGKGDLFCYAPANPVTVGERGVSVRVPCYPRDDIASFQTSGEPVKRQRRETVRLREAAATPPHAAALSGVVTDESGRPLPGMTVMGFRRTEGERFSIRILRLKGDAMTVTDGEGRFTLPLPGEGRWTVMAREHAAASPSPGERFGLYEGNVEHAVDSRNPPAPLAIVASRIMTKDPLPPPGTGVTNPAVTTTGDRVIDRDTVWSGTVTVDGVVVVGRRATLTILPGTTVRFRRIDSDGDGIGDGELRILGRLVAEGTRERPVRFVSAEPKPQPGDWSYILVFAAAGESRLRHCIVRDAFTGVQGHFSRLFLTDCELSGNREGIRYGRADMMISHCTVTGNDVGIRYHRHEGEVVMEGNLITRNRIGLFFVPSGQNRPDFSLDEYVPAPALAAPPDIRGNGIFGNREHDFRHGFRQTADSVVPGNWWGTTDLREISRRLHDRDDDPELGRVVVEPLLAAPPPSMGRRE